MAALTPGFAYWLADVAAWLAWRYRHGHRRAVRRNLLPALDGDRDATRDASLEVFKNVGRYYVDMATMKYRDLDELNTQELEIVGEERLDQFRAADRAMIVSAHIGNPEVAVQALSRRGRDFAALVEPLAERAYAQVLLDIRASGGGHYYEATISGARAALRDLRAGTVLCTLGDRDLHGTGVCIQFMDRFVRVPRGPWQIARREGALVFPMFAERVGRRGTRVTIEEPFLVPRGGELEHDICRAATRWAKLLEDAIRRAPGQWTVMEDFWRVYRCCPDHATQPTRHARST